MRLVGFIIVPFLFLLTPQSTAAQKRTSDCGKEPRLEISDKKMWLRIKKVIDGGLEQTFTRIGSDGAKNLQAIIYYVCRAQLYYGISEEKAHQYVKIAFGIKESEPEDNSITKKDVPEIIREYHRAINNGKYVSLLESLSFPMAKFHEWNNYSSHEVKKVLQADREKRTVKTEIDYNSIEIHSRSDGGYNVSYRFTQFDRYKDGTRKTWKVKEQLMINPAGKIYYIYQPETILQK